MKLKFPDLFRWDGEISRAPFLLWAMILFAVKYNLDRLLLGIGFSHYWSVFSYFEGPMTWLKGLSPAENPKEFMALLVASLPFLWAGVVLCLKRLRSARLPLWLAILFVVPMLKWFLFVALAIVPQRKESGMETSITATPRSKRGRWLPKTAFGSAALSVGLSTLLALGAAALGAQVLQQYGWGLFVGVPFCMGFLAAVLHGAQQRRTVGQSILVGVLSIALTAAALMALAFEGVICLMMAAPLAGALALLGALVGQVVQSSRWRNTPPQLYCVPFLAVPLMLGADKFEGERPPLLQVTTAIEINAPPERVWHHVVTFSQLPPPSEVIFKLGVAYPICAEIKGSGVGAVRNCIFSTGPFVEPIEVWDEPRLLRFSVTHNPEPMQEWTPYHEIHPPHLDGFLVSQQGQFLLTPLPGGRTRLEGTTWYHHTMWLANYWQLWSDQIIHTIHLRVLNHVKELSEKDSRYGQIKAVNVHSTPGERGLGNE